MGRFDVQSGVVSLVLAGSDAESVARAALRRTINKYFPVEDIEIRLLNRLSTEVVLKGLDEMDCFIAVSQIGFERSEAGLFNRDELFSRWRTNIYSISYLFDQLSSLGEIHEPSSAIDPESDPA
jgi:hypothetical protein